MIFILFLAQLVCAGQEKLPRFTQVKGKVEIITGRDEKFALANLKTIFIEKARIKTSVDSEATIKINSQLEIKVLPQTELSLPGISWEGGYVPALQLHFGSIRWTATGSSEKEGQTKLRSDLFDLSPGVGDFLISYAPDRAFAEAMVFRGELSFSALFAEQNAQLKSFERVSFQGKIEDGAIAYDYLLDGKKVPRGLLSPVSALTEAEKKAHTDEAQKRVQKHADQQKKLKKQAEDRKKQGYICQKPEGKFNDCVWRLSGSRCLRLRCNANGNWVDSTVVSDSRGCLKKEVVAACDY